MQAYQVQFRDPKIKTRTGQFLRYLGPDQDQVHFIKTLDRTRPGVLVQDWQNQQKMSNLPPDKDQQNLENVGPDRNQQ